MAAAPNYQWSKRWKCMLNTAGRPEGYGRCVTMPSVIKLAVLRGAEAKGLPVGR